MKKALIFIMSAAALTASAGVLLLRYVKPKNTLYLGKNGYGHKLTVVEIRKAGKSDNR